MSNFGKAALIGAVIACAGHAQDCEPGWSDEFAPGGVGSLVRCAAVYDDGTGPALYVGGNFTMAGGIAAHRIARWDGHRWSALTEEIGESLWVAALTVFDEDGVGPNPPSLFAAGVFSVTGKVAASNIARWDGKSWSALGYGLTSCCPGVVHALAT